MRRIGTRRSWGGSSADVYQLPCRIALATLSIVAKSTILCVCSHGAGKSVLAAEYFNRLAQEAELPYVAVAMAADEPFAAVLDPVAELLRREGVDVHSFEPRRVRVDDVRTAAKVISVGCDLSALVPTASLEVWDDVPQPSQDLPGSAAAIRQHVAKLVEELRGESAPQVRKQMSEVNIRPFQNGDADGVAKLILGIQRDEFQIAITLQQQPDLSSIPDFYQTGAGNFWVAVLDDEIVGTLALRDIGGGDVALRKMFVAATVRGAPHRVAQRLLSSALDWASANQTETIYLGTTSRFLAAHRFYEKNGFELVAPETLPKSFPLMAVDTRFYRRRLRTAEGVQ